MSPSVVQRIHAKLREVNAIFPGVTAAAILGPDGQAIVKETQDAAKFTSVMTMVATLKRSTLQFGETLGQMETPVIHVSGSHTVFSCYDVGPNVLAFFSGMASTAVELFDTAEADAKMVPILEDLRLLLHNISP
jgi:predicted regulator of Ras-like GTPase activity (Roadblock/LC7/MglB family)